MTPILDTDIAVFLVGIWPQISTNLLCTMQTVDSLLNTALNRYFAELTGGEWDCAIVSGDLLRAILIHIMGVVYYV